MVVMVMAHSSSDYLVLPSTSQYMSKSICTHAVAFGEEHEDHVTWQLTRMVLRDLVGSCSPPTVYPAAP